MIDNTALAAWLRLTLIPGLGRESQRKLLSAFGLPEHIFGAGRSALRGVVGDKADLILDTDVEAAVQNALVWASQAGHYIITLADSAYPPQLLEIPDPPTLLYVRGNPAWLMRPGLAMVGSRNPTPQGLRAAEDFAHTLAERGLAIISGLALGIDGAAHRGALLAGEGTVAVVGTGADRLYPARHQDLAWKIIEKGAIVSEFPLGTPAVGANFPRRNRIISGLARGVLVVEAALESGSLITARLAAEQGREVFAIPGSIHSPVSRGCHRLIKQGAKLVESAQDVLEELGELVFPAMSDVVDVAVHAAIAGPAGGLAGDREKQILSELGFEPCTLDDLVGRSGLTADTLLAILMALELEGLIAVLPGNRYQRLSA